MTRVRSWGVGENGDGGGGVAATVLMTTMATVGSGLPLTSARIPDRWELGSVPLFLPVMDSGKLLRSTSALVGSTESGRHMLKIEGYSHIKEVITNTNYIRSRHFRVGGHDWCIRYYPNGLYSGRFEYISVLLFLDSSVNQGVRAHFSFIVLNQAGEPMPPIWNYYNSGYTFTSYDWEGPRAFINKATLERSGPLHDNCFTIRCDLMVIMSPEAKGVDTESPTPPPPPPPSPVVSVPPSDLIRHLGDLLVTGNGADVTFEVNGKMFLAHRSVLASRSPVLHAELFGSGGKKNDAIVHVDDMEAQDFEALLRFMYTDSLPEMKSGDVVAMLPDLVAAANRYKMERLRLVCEDMLCGYVNVRTVAAMLAFAGEHHCHGLKNKCLQLLDDPAKLREIVETEGLEHLTKSYPLVLKDLIANTESGQHLLEINGYSSIKDAVLTGNCVQSRHFHVGGHDWYVQYYPNGYSSVVSDCISISLVFGHHGYYYRGPIVRAELTLSLLDQDGEPAVTSYTYSHGVQTFDSYGRYQGTSRFIQKAVLERSEYLRDVQLLHDQNPEANDVEDTGGRVALPPSDLARHLGSLLATGVGTDVTFEHIDLNVLAARSPVFHDELFAPTEKENVVVGSAGAIVRVDDMEAQDFEALLHFMYTDSLPKMKGGDAAAMLSDLVAAANKYKMERLRLVCEDKLCEYVNARIVAAMLAFAGEHHCPDLKKKCLLLLEDPANLRKIVETEGLEYLTKSYAFVLKDLIAMFASGKFGKREMHESPNTSPQRRHRPPLRSAFAVIAGTESGQHLLKTEGYSRIKDTIPNGGEIKSRSFHVGGHSWYISYYPSGYNSDNTDYISIFLQLDKNVEKGVKAEYKFSLLDCAGKPSYSWSSKGPTIFCDDRWGFMHFIKRDQLEKSEYLQYDCFTIMCEYTVFMEVQTEDIEVTAATPPPQLVPPPTPKVVVPPSDLHLHLGGLLSTREGADVTLEVNGKTFVSHRWVLAARSPVFREKLFGLGKESATTNGIVDIICIDDMEMQDFEALLRYMYTDSLLEMKGGEEAAMMKGGEEAAMLPDLVAAANRYKIERLRLVCEQKLCEYVNGRTVVAMLAFAEEHHCNGLKENCLHFLDDPVKLREIVKAEGLENLSKSYPSILKDLIAKLAAVPTRKPVRSASAIIAGTESGQHLLKIDGYSRTKEELPTGNIIKSRSFHAGGHSWHLLYYPNGFNSDCAECISIFLQLDYNIVKGVKAQYKFSLLDRAGKPTYSRSSGKANVFLNTGWGYRTYIERELLETSEYLVDDCLTIVCDFTVFKDLQTEDIDVNDAAPPPPIVVVPPSDLHRHLAGLLATGEGADVTFEVEGKTFVAHKWVLVARSPVLRAMLIGTTTSGAGNIVCVDAMKAEDFEALLYYMYTDSLPEMKGGEAVAMLPDLVAAANRYKMERLRLVCEHKLCEYVNGRTVVAMLAFAGEHECDGLKEKCLRFLDDPVKLREIVLAEGVENLSKSYPSILKDLIAKLAAIPVAS
uniref:Uncharacterized protein n=1 Tax=Oryza punctata TaxID=4537 RepID=A0A0E0KQU1_ORYPU